MLSLALSGRMLIGEARDTATEVIDAIGGVADFPTLAVLPADGGEKVVYEGEMKPAALAAFLEQHAAPAEAEQPRRVPPARRTRPRTVHRCGQRGEPRRGRARHGSSSLPARLPRTCRRRAASTRSRRHSTGRWRARRRRSANLASLSAPSR